MNGRIRFSLAAAFAVMIFSALSAVAQPLVWNPPCATLRVKNLTAVPVTISLVTVPAGAVPVLVAPPMFESPTVPVPAGTQIAGITSAGGFFYPVIQPAPPSPPAPIAANGWIPGVVVQGPPAICVDVYLDLFNCTVYILPGTPPCRP